MISVIIPLYNKETIIDKSLRSVLSQDYDDFEVVVVNDGSTDKSAEIVRQINDSHLKLIEQKNGGPSKARNTGVKNAEGEWIVFLDADDEFLPGALDCFHKLSIMHKECNFISCSYYVRDSKGVETPHIMEDGEVRNIFKDFYFYRFHTRTGIAIYKKSLVSSNPFNEKYRRYEDFDVWFRMFKNTRLYVSSIAVLIENQSINGASEARGNISEDFVGNMNFSNRGFWEKMCLYKLYLGERNHYVGQIEALYPNLDKRYDLLFLYKIFQLYNKIS